MTGERVRDHRDPHAFSQRTQVAMCDRCGAVRRLDGSNERESCRTYLDAQRAMVDAWERERETERETDVGPSRHELQVDTPTQRPGSGS